jgi:penicillin-binding protein 2
MAPIDQPTVALAVIVENSGFGSEAAAPIARRVFDYLLAGQYPSEEDMAATQIGKSSAPIGTPRRASDIPLPGAGGSVAMSPGHTPAGAVAAARPPATHP